VRQHAAVDATFFFWPKLHQSIASEQFSQPGSLVFAIASIWKSFSMFSDESYDIFLTSKVVTQQALHEMT